MLSKPIELNSTLCGKTKRVSELRDGSLLVAVSNEDQSRNIKILKTLDKIPILVTDQQHLNQIRLKGQSGTEICLRTHPRISSKS